MGKKSRIKEARKAMYLAGVADSAEAHLKTLARLITSEEQLQRIVAQSSPEMREEVEALIRANSNITVQ